MLTTKEKIHNQILVLVPYLLLVVVHLLMGLQMKQPTVLADEVGYLGNARYLAGVASMPDLRYCTFYHFGYSLFLVPLFWLFKDPLVDCNTGIGSVMRFSG